MARARTVVYSSAGLPAYAGQAYLITGCSGGGAFCHSSDSTANRYGAPAGLDFDPVLADHGDPTVSPTPAEQEGAQRLYHAQLASHHWRDDIFGTMVGGSMPPRGVGNDVQQPLYADATGNTLPDIRSAEAREIVRNWLACGSPVVEAVAAPTPIPCSSNEQCLTRHCDTTAGQCIGVGAVEPPHGGMVDPTFTNVYSTVLRPSCASLACHGSVGAPRSGMLDLSTPALAYAALVGTAASGATCGTRVVAGHPEMSYLMAKLQGTQSVACGDPMPIGAPLASAQIQLVSDWITAGAMNN